MIPIYRARKIDSDEYFEGTGTTDFLNVNQYNPELYNGEHTWLWSNYQWIEIDPSTLAIHFPDMIDSEGTKIFASLGKNNKGGDRLESDKFLPDGTTAIFYKYGISLQTKTGEVDLQHKLLKVIGIQE